MQWCQNSQGHLDHRTRPQEVLNLKRSLGEQIFTYEEFSTLIAQIESLVVEPSG